MIFYNMGNNYIERNNSFHTQAAYYRLIAPLLFDSDRIIHLDGDTLIFKDLNEMYNLDFNDNYVLGIYDFISDGIDYLGIKSNIYINDGVILFNLKKVREDNKIFGLIDMITRKTYLKNEDQTILNYILYPKIGRIPSKYVIINFNDKSSINIYLNYLRTKFPMKEIEEALNSPTIIHHISCAPKPWFINLTFQKICSFNDGQKKNCSCRKYFDIWHSFAKNTDYYEEIAKFTGVKI